MRYQDFGKIIVVTLFLSTIGAVAVGGLQLPTLTQLFRGEIVGPQDPNLSAINPALVPVIAPRPGIAPSAPAALTPPPAVPPVTTPPEPVTSAVIEGESYQYTEDGYAPWDNRIHHVFLREDGTIRGEVGYVDPSVANFVGLENVTITLIHNHVVVDQAVSGEKGQFLLTKLKSGVHAMIVNDPRVFAAYGILVLPEREGAERDVFQIRATCVPEWDLPITRHLQFTAYDGMTPITRLIEPPVEKIPDFVKDLPKPGIPGTSLKLYPVELTSTGHLTGRIRRLHPVTGHPLVPLGAMVHFIQENKVIYRAQVGLGGKIDIPSFEPGAYSVVVTGQLGFAAVGIQVVPFSREPAVGQTPYDDHSHFVAFQDPPVDEEEVVDLDIATIDPQDLPPVVEEEETDDEAIGGAPGFAPGAGGAIGGDLSPLALLGLLGLLGDDDPPFVTPVDPDPMMP